MPLTDDEYNKLIEDFKASKIGKQFQSDKDVLDSAHASLSTQVNSLAGQKRVNRSEYKSVVADEISAQNDYIADAVKPQSNVSNNSSVSDSNNGNIEKLAKLPWNE